MLREVLSGDRVHCQQGAEDHQDFLPAQPGAGKKSTDDNVVPGEQQQVEDHSARQISCAENFVAPQYGNIPRNGENDDGEGAEQQRAKGEGGSSFVDLFPDGCSPC